MLTDMLCQFRVRACADRTRACERDRRWRARSSTPARRAPCHNSEPRRASVSGSSPRPPNGMDRKLWARLRFAGVRTSKAVSRRRRGPQVSLYRTCHPAILGHPGRRLATAQPGVSNRAAVHHPQADMSSGGSLRSPMEASASTIAASGAVSRRSCIRAPSSPSRFHRSFAT